MILTDTGYWIALAGVKDKYHQQALDVSRQIDSELVITWPVMTETCHLLANRVSPEAPAKFMQQVEQFVSIFNVDISHIQRIRVLLQQYQDLPMDLADASLVVAAEELACGDILSTDRRDFNAYRWKNHKPFRNLLFPYD
ncbi:hypothetical protein MNBD_GAMMA10-3290 [hydrothermal vent metagenome]|uniref:Uncharacterized protein n=1 Tax=hydrothermal vent metagenome TaxID=652676 RepID=A0A3B0YDQ4_9ZZZZ